MRAPGSLTVLALMLGLATAVRVVSAEELMLSAAISTKDAVEEVGRRFTQPRREVTLRYNFGSSGELAQQIEAGAPVDIFISAADRQMDELERTGRLVAGTRRTFARNVLTVITTVDAPHPLSRPEDLAGPGVQRIVIGDPRTVPVGQYAEESLRALGLWEKLQPKLVLAGNVRQALEYVARGEVDAGFVYTTDVAVRVGRVKEAFRPPETTYRPITYPVAVVAGTAHAELARHFIDLLVGPEGSAILARFGFQPARVIPMTLPRAP
jgi:molybdate transport system substrate-binding protein